jgi:hypothetical protein
MILQLNKLACDTRKTRNSLPYQNCLEKINNQPIKNLVIT